MLKNTSKTEEEVIKLYLFSIHLEGNRQNEKDRQGSVSFGAPVLQRGEISLHITTACEP